MYRHNGTPPPPYYPPAASLSQSRPKVASLSSLPVHLVHRILIFTLDEKATPSRFQSDSEEERIRRIWNLFRGLRGISRIFWLVATSILREIYLPHYLSQVRSGYSSDPCPFPSVYMGDLSLQLPNLGNVYKERRRETAVLDKFIAVHVGEELRKVESVLSEGTESERDIFNRLQPSSRIEDLLVTLPPHLIICSNSWPTPIPRRSLPLSHCLLSVHLTPTWCQLYINARPILLTRDPGGRELVIEVRRERTLESTTRNLENGLSRMAKREIEWGGRYSGQT
ncbi:uncharacterized protein L203_105916 [Cryptococcus depauperatus CBS 7841]|uniref:Uncharacterized protein n=1 Tax=Cryptococcus depauperatus CBS 7841 TaxID=1295531 RepID=A0A1E3HJ48_9TREE|nr:hypothetical protein L203_06429 [Cryptococcus depauperatus CBS 7841]